MRSAGRSSSMKPRPVWPGRCRNAHNPHPGRRKLARAFSLCEVHNDETIHDPQRPRHRRPAERGRGLKSETTETDRRVQPTVAAASMVGIESPQDTGRQKADIILLDYVFTLV